MTDLLEAALGRRASKPLEEANMTDSVEVPRQLIERLDDLLNNGVRGPVVRMLMPRRTDYGCYWELDGGYDSQYALAQSMHYRVEILRIADEVRQLAARLEASP